MRARSAVILAVILLSGLGPVFIAAVAPATAQVPSPSGPALQVPSGRPGEVVLPESLRLGDRGTGSPDDTYIVVLRPPSVLEQLGSLLRRGRTVDLAVRATDVVEAAVGRPGRDLTRLMGAISAELDDAALARLEADPRVTAIIPNVPVRTSERRVADRRMLPDPDPAMDPAYLWNLDRIDRVSGGPDREYRATSTGAGVDVYVLDTGIRFVHNDFIDAAGVSRIVPATAFPDSTSPGGYYDATYFYDVTGSIFAAPGYRVAQDCQLHGAHVSATATGRLSGIASGAGIVPVKVFPGCALGTQFIEDILGGMQWVLDKRRDGVSAVVNMSLGSGPFTPASAFPELDAAVNSLVNAGISVVVAAGNDDDDACAFWPARVASAITVGSTTSTDVRSAFSNHGSCVDIFAPGSDIDAACALIRVVDNTVSLDAEGYFVYRNDCTVNSTIRIGGTSMAAPLVTGLVARHLQLNPTATPAQVKNALLAGGLSGTGIVPLVTERKVGSPDLLANSVFLEPPGPSSSDPAPVPAVVVCAGLESGARVLQLPASGVSPLTWDTTEGALPGSLVLTSRGRLTGTGSSNFGTTTIRVQDAFGRSASWPVSLGQLPPGCPVS